MSLRPSLWLTTALALATALPGLADGLDARLSATRVAEGDQVVLTLSADAATGAGQPDLTALDTDFTVLGTASGSQTTIVNGVRSDRVTWQITLAPKHGGALTVPAIAAGSASSAPLALEVVAAADLPPAAQAGRPSITVAAPDASIYVHEEVPITVQARVPAGTRQAEIVAPTSAGYLLEQSGEDRVTAQSDGTTLVERSYLLRPQQEGALSLGGFTITAEVIAPDARDPFDRLGQSGFADTMLSDFFGRSPLSGGGFGSVFAPTRTVTTTSDPVSLTVLPTPTGASGWALPAQAVELHETWQPDPPMLRVGEAVTRKVQVVALGAHPEQIPDLTMPEVPGARVYYEGSDKKSVPTEHGTAAMREFTWSIVPTSGGTITLPELGVDWFDTGTEAPARATLAAESYHVEGPVAEAPAQSAAAVAPAVAPDVATPADENWMTTGLIAGCGLVALALGLVAAMALRARRNGTKPQPAAGPALVAAARRKAALARARRAARHGDAAGTRGAALDWIRWAGLTPDTVAARFPALGAALYGLEAAAFGRTDTNPDLRGLVAALRAADRNLRRGARRGTALPPLYPATT